jgi:hypothetical protein
MVSEYEFLLINNRIQINYILLIQIQAALIVVGV